MHQLGGDGSRHGETHPCQPVGEQCRGSPLPDLVVLIPTSVRFCGEKPSRSRLGCRIPGWLPIRSLVAKPEVGRSRTDLRSGGLLGDPLGGNPRSLRMPVPTGFRTRVGRQPHSRLDRAGAP